MSDLFGIVPDDWKTTTGTLSKVDPPVANAGSGWYRLAPSGPFANIKAPIDLQDFQLKFKFMIVGTTPAYFSLLFRSRSDVNGRTAQHLLWISDTSTWNLGIYDQAGTARAIDSGIDVDLNFNTVYDFQIIVKGTNLKVYIDGVLEINSNTLMSGFGNSIGFECISADDLIYFKDMMITPPPKANDFSKVEVIDVGNRRFMCELVKKVKWSELTKAGTTSPTNLGTEDDPIIDCFDNTNLADRTSIFSLTTGVQYIGDEHIVAFDAARMPDDNSTDALRSYWRLIRDATSTCENNLYTSNYTSWTIGTSGPANQDITRSKTWGAGGDYRPVRAGICGGIYFGCIDEVYWEMPQSYPSNAFSKTLSIPYVQNRHDAGEQSHWRYKNFKLFRIIAEARP